LELISAAWAKVTKDTIVNCFIKANCLPQPHFNNIMKLTEKGRAKLAAMATVEGTAAAAAPAAAAAAAPAAAAAAASATAAAAAVAVADTAGDSAAGAAADPEEHEEEQLDAADADLVASLEPSDEEIQAMMQTMDRIALTVTTSTIFQNSKSQRPALLQDVIVAAPGVDKLKAALDSLTIEDNPLVQDLIVKEADRAALAELAPASEAGAAAMVVDDSGDEEPSSTANDATPFSEDAFETFEAMLPQFFATVNKFAPAAGRKHTGAVVNLVRAVKQGMREGRKLVQPSISSFFQ